jgi:predicted DNA-binding protein
MVERTTVRLPEELLNRARRKAAAEGRTLTALIEEGLRLAVAPKPKAPPAERRLPRVSTATGGFYPGVDISNNASIQEMEDLEYIERLNRGFK